MANILSRFMTDAHTERVVVAFCFLLTICVFGFLMIVILLADPPKSRHNSTFSVSEKGHVVLKTDTYAH
jgi:hypothetical protein